MLRSLVSEPRVAARSSARREAQRADEYAGEALICEPSSTKWTAPGFN
jgi:hypothetical protein